MKILVLLPRARTLAWSMFADGRRQPLAQGTIADYRGEAASALALQTVFQAVAGAGLAPELVAVYAAETGERFAGPVRLDAGVAAALVELVPQSPLLLPALRDLVRVLIREFPAMPAARVESGPCPGGSPEMRKNHAFR